MFDLRFSGGDACKDLLVSECLRTKVKTENGDIFRHISYLLLNHTPTYEIPWELVKLKTSTQVLCGLIATKQRQFYGEILGECRRILELGFQ